MVVLEGLQHQGLQSVCVIIVERNSQAAGQCFHARSRTFSNSIYWDIIAFQPHVASVRSITDTLSSNKSKVDHKTVGKYIDALCKAFAFYRIRRYDIRGKRYLYSEDKYYLADQSFRFARLGMKNMDYGRVLENIIAIELLRRGCEVYAGSSIKKKSILSP